MKRNIIKIIPVVAVATTMMATSVFAQAVAEVEIPKGILEKDEILGEDGLNQEILEQNTMFGKGELAPEIVPAEHTKTQYAVDNSIYIDGEKLELTLIAKNGVANFPVREVFEKLGYKVGYKAETKQITISKGPHYVMFSTTKDAYSFSRMALMPLGQVPMVIQGVTYVPVTLLTEVMSMPNVALKEDAGMHLLTIGTKMPLVPEVPVTPNIEVDPSGIAQTEPRILQSEIQAIDKENNTITILDENGMEIVLTLGENTKKIYKEGENEFKLGQKVEAQLSMAQTMSLPPINNPAYVKVLGEINTGTITNILTDSENNTRVTYMDEKLGNIVLVLPEGFEVDFSELETKELEAGQKIQVELGAEMTGDNENTPVSVKVAPVKRADLEKITGKATIVSADLEAGVIIVKNDDMDKPELAYMEEIVLLVGEQNTDLEIEIEGGIGAHMIAMHEWAKEGQKLEIEYSPMFMRSLPAKNVPKKITVLK